jgi:hypothetical protein
MSDTTAYLSGGRLGDFLQQLSVVYERFLVDQKPARVYICERGDTFQHGLQRAYEDLSPILSRQPYIQEFKVHEGEPYDVDLTSWRGYIGAHDFLTSMKNAYQVDWAKHPWLLHIPKDPQWQDRVVINTTHYRFPDEIPWKQVFQKKNNVVFVGFDEKEHRHFIQRTHHQPPFHRPSSLWELCVILNSCRHMVGSLSAPLSMAIGLRTPLTIGFFGRKTNHLDYILFHCLRPFQKMI